MKVLVVGPSITKSKGGMATVIKSISESEILSREHDITILPSYIDGNIVVRLMYSIIYYIKYLNMLKYVDVVHIHMASRGSTWRKCQYIKKAKKNGKKVLLHIHGASYKEFYQDECNLKKQRKICEVLNIVDKVIVLSEEWKMFFKNLCDKNKIVVLHNAVKIPNFNRDDYSDCNVLFLGRLGKRKGTYDLIESIPKVVEKIPEARFFIAGDGEIDACKKLCRDKGIENYVEFLGWISEEDREKYLELSSTYILPSYNEGMPMSVLEAMSWGCCVISTPVGGIPQVIDNEINGILVKTGHVSQISNSIIYILSDKEKKKKLGCNAMHSIKNKFSIDTWSKELMQLYNIK